MNRKSLDDITLMKAAVVIPVIMFFAFSGLREAAAFFSLLGYGLGVGLTKLVEKDKRDRVSSNLDQD